MRKTLGPPPIKTILKKKISLFTYTHFKRNSPEKDVVCFVLFFRESNKIWKSTQKKTYSQRGLEIYCNRKKHRSPSRTQCPNPGTHSEEPCLPAWDLMGASASSPGVARIPPGQRRGLQAVCGTATMDQSEGCIKELRGGAETCAAKPVWNRAAAPAVALRRGRLLRRPSPGIIRSQVTFQPGPESKPPPSLLAMGFSGFSVSLKVTSQCGAELRKGGLRAAGVSEKQS